MQQHNTPKGELPLGFAMALAQNPEAMSRFSSMTEQQQAAILAQTHAVSSRGEMHALVQSIAEGRQFLG